jgi:hypothetical protein
VSLTRQEGQEEERKKRGEKIERRKPIKQKRAKEKVEDAKLTSSDPLYVASNMK